MSRNLGCEDVRELAPELALDVVDGEERHAALRHLADCPGCRRLVSELSSMSDAFLLLAPSAEPPVGFESRVLDRLETPAPPPGQVRRRPHLPRWRARPRPGSPGAMPRRRRLSPALAAVTAAILAAAIGVVSVLVATAEDRRLGGAYEALLAEGGGSFFTVAPFQGPTVRVGTAFGYQGRPSWLFVTLSAPAEEQRYRVRIVTGNARYVDLGEAVLGGKQSGWGRAIPVDLASVAELRFSKPGGREVLVARFRPQSPWGDG